MTKAPARQMGARMTEYFGNHHRERGQGMSQYGHNTETKIKELEEGLVQIDFNLGEAGVKVGPLPIPVPASPGHSPRGRSPRYAS